MEILKNKNGNEFVVELKGRLDTVTAPDLDAVLKSELADVNSLVFDFKELEYISSAGLRVLLATQKQMDQQGKMVVKNVNEQIMEVFEITGFTDILTIE